MNDLLYNFIILAHYYLNKEDYMNKIYFYFY